MTGGLFAAALLLVIAGAAKLVRPHDTARALGHRRSTWVRVGAAVEVAIGVAAMATPVAAWAVAASYAAFAAYVAVALRRGWVLSTCGCFGEPDTPPTRLHVVVNLALAAGAAAAPTAPLQPPHVVQLAQGAVIAGLAYLVLARLPKLQVAG